MEECLDRQIRHLMVRNLDKVKELMISRKLANELKWMAEQPNGVSSDDVADEIGITVTNASTQLNSLYRKGYLVRRPRNNETGGIEYIYFVSPELGLE